MKTLLVLALLIGVSAPVSASLKKVPLTVSDSGHLTMLATINGVEAKFIVDTGATGSVIDVHQLATFNIEKPEASIDGVGIGDEESGNVATYIIDIESYEIADLPVALSKIFSNDTAFMGEEYAGLIGRDALVELHALVDLTVPQLLVPEKEDDIKTFFEQPANQTYSAEPLISTAMGFSLIRGAINQNPVNLLLDTGSSMVVLDKTAVKDQLKLHVEDHPTAKTQNAAGQEVSMQRITGEHLQVGGAEITGDFMVTDFGALKAAVEQDYEGIFAGIVGNSLLKQHAAIVDVKNNTLYLR